MNENKIVLREKLSEYFSEIFEEDLINEIIEVGSLNVIPKGELLIDIGDDLTHIPLIIHGAIKIMLEDQNGEEISLYYLEKGETCAISFVKYRSWRHYIIDSYHYRLIGLVHSIENLAFLNLEDRLIKYLVDKIKIMRSNILKTTHEEIATDIHTSRTVVSRLLKDLENEGKLKLRRNRIIIHSSALNLWK